MYAIVREGNGKYYMSMVFGYYNTTDDRWDYNHRYWVVLNREKTELINQSVLPPKSKYLTPMVLAVDSDQHDWKLDNEHAQSIDFLPTDTLFEMIDTKTVPEELLRRCIEMDWDYKYDPFPEIQSEKDIEDFDWVSGGLHDAYISKLEKAEDTVYVLFEGTWGCTIEVWFSGDVTYDTTSRDPEEYDPYWGDSKILIHDGYIYLIDDECAAVENARDGWCWFKAKHMKYHIIPK